MEWRMHGFNREWDAKVEVRMLKFIAGIRLRWGGWSGVAQI